MIWILSTRGASSRLRDAPFTETPIEGVQSVVYKPGVAAIVESGGGAGEGALGTFSRGLHRVSGFVFSLDGSVGETLLEIAAPIDLIVRYQANGQTRRRTFLDVVFAGDATVVFPNVNIGIPTPIGVPFRVQIATPSTLADHILDEVDV